MAVSNPVTTPERDDLPHAMQALSVEHRQAINLVSVEGLTCRDAALVCGCAERTMKSRVGRARAVLATMIARNRLSGEPPRALAAILADAQRACTPGGRRTHYPC